MVFLMGVCGLQAVPKVLIMTLLYFDSLFFEHDTGQHPECAERLRQVAGHLDREGLFDRVERPRWEAASADQITRVHGRWVLNSLEQLAANGGGQVDADTVVSPRSVEVARRAAGALCDAVGRVIGGDAERALCLVRPPGHHATPERAMGFCLLNNVAVAAQAALDLGLERVLIVDWDVHHGNGTQDCFYDDPRVGFFSVHRWPFYPGTGSSEETGTGDGLTTTCNMPVAFGTSRDAYRSQVLRELETFAARMQPELVLVSAGFDAHREDPVGSLGLELEDFGWLTESVRQIADSYAAGRLVSSLEGGYNPPVLAECVAVHLDCLLSEPADGADGHG